MASTRSYFCIAYGGAPILCPPGHTLESLKKGIEVGASMLAVEVRVTRDNEMVVGTSLQRLVADEPVFLTDHTLAEWQRITENDSDKITTLDEVLTLVCQTRCGLLIDIRVSGIEHILARKLRKSGIPLDSLLIANSNPGGRTVLRSLDPKIPQAHKFSMDHMAKVDAGTMKDIDTDAVIWPAHLLDSKTVKSLKASGIIVYAGVVNLASEMRKLRDECGVDGIVTPYPDLLLTLSEKPKAVAW